ncbi:cupin domain-containing protein [Clostridium cellulovorans]|uniref:Cupin 2 conserved barrel domain protein n=1 Tax=Clostridium cellulovorans (strain ATCC 35296 / DSM 3052 / OCM 3 / 743B) TaxID=573061 RepID=D9SVJ1_CLOC7|nr:cupin domain-containing protein [Clostridium cellulovorans]ADL51115.1 Cupin 2 conserved barrel domain protein [Clostridium cellulovorans 743B]
MVGNIKDINEVEVKAEGAEGAKKLTLIGPKEGWEGYVMREFHLEVHGHTPKHTHPWPHINYILKGHGILHLDGQNYKINEGSYAYVPSGALHQFQNIGEGTLSFICIVPEEGDK